MRERTPSTAGEAVAKTAGKAVAKTAEKVTGEAAGKAAGKTAGRTTGKTVGKVAGGTAAEVAGKTAGKAAEAQPSQARQALRQGPLRLQQVDAERLLREAGLRVTSSGGCSNRQGRTCTSLQAVRSGTISSAIDLKRRSGCRLVVTGGTEVGHAPGPYSHFAGYKLDIKPNRCINRYITKNHPSQGVRGDRARLYGADGTSGPLYAREADHWDILFR
ncbi:hypothetical protein [Streptosporangium sp. NPDC023615]|uniref:hypothetical protein n=1 Tax=Streptosporangium sp. NPDC023615 TaxID=3154794 RepID=UPI0034331139